MDEQLAEAVIRQTIGYAVLHEGGQARFSVEEDAIAFAEEVDGIVAYIVSIKTITLDEVFGD